MLELQKIKVIVTILFLLDQNLEDSFLVQFVAKMYSENSSCQQLFFFSMNYRTWKKNCLENILQTDTGLENIKSRGIFYIHPEPLNHPSKGQ